MLLVVHSILYNSGHLVCGSINTVKQFGYGWKQCVSTLPALAAIAAVGAASAQVTVYGKLDVGVSNTSAGGTVIGSSGWETSRLGVKAAETVGGLTASVNLEGKIYNDGSTAFKGFDRTATVGLSGSFGAVTIGNQWSPYDNALWTTDALEYNGFSVLAGGMYNYDIGNTKVGTVRSSFQYATPDMNGFQAFLMVAPNVTGNTDGPTNYSGFGVNYAKGPLVVQYAYQAYDGKYQADSAAGVTPVVKAAQIGTGSVTANVLALNYNLGTATLYAGMTKVSDITTSDSGYTFGVKVPMGKNSVSVGYASNKTSAASKDTTIGAWGAQFIQGLNKSTVAYYGIQSIDSVNKTSAGLRVNF